MEEEEGNFVLTGFFEAGKRSPEPPLSPNSPLDPANSKKTKKCHNYHDAILFYQRYTRTHTHVYLDNEHINTLTAHKAKVLYITLQFI